MNWKNRKVVVTGGSGFIGTHLCNHLISLGATVYVMVHKTPYTGGHAEQFIGDLLDRHGWEDVLKSINPEVVFHLAAQPLVSVAGSLAYETLDTNVRGTYNLLDVCKDIKSIKSFVHISTDKVFGNTDIILDESSMDGSTHPYNASKVASDTLAQMYANFFKVPMVIIRNANVYGDGDLHFDRIVPNTILAVYKGQSPVIRGDGSNLRDYIYVGDVVRGYVKAAELSSSPLTILNLGGYNHSTSDVVDTILMKMSRVDLPPKHETQWAGEIPNQHIESEKARKLIDWKPVTSLSDGLDLAIPWYVQNFKEKNV